MEGRLWKLEDSRVFRILQRLAISGEAIKTRLRQAINPGAEAEEKRQAYRLWLEQNTASGRNIASLGYQPRFQVVDGSARDGSAQDCSADYFIFVAPGGRLLPNALYDLAESVQRERFGVLYGDEDHGPAPLLKPDWSPELVELPMYVGRFLAVRKDILESAGDFRDPIDLAQKLAARKVRFHHVPRILVSFDMPATAAAVPRARKVAGTPLASIIICSRNPSLLKSCLDSIQRKTSYPHREIVVVEHVAGDKRLLPGATYTRIGYSGRFNFAAMSNQGAKGSKGEILVFLNDDVQPLASEWLEALVAQAQRPEVGAVGALLLYPNGSIQHAGIVLGIGGYVGHAGRGRFNCGFWPWLTMTRNVSAVTGACLAMRRQVFDELHGFDLAFPVNYNDVDLCLRARQAGYEVILEAAARLSHYESRTRTRSVKWEEVDNFADRWSETIAQGDPFYSPNLSLRNESCELAD